MTTATDARAALDALDDYARMDCSVDPIGSRNVLTRYIDQTEKVEERFLLIRAMFIANMLRHMPNKTKYEIADEIDRLMLEGGGMIDAND
jgi:hypothetical protein